MIFDKIISIVYRKPIRVVFFDWNTSIGMASEMIRLWIPYGVAGGFSVIFIKGYNLTSIFKGTTTPSEIFKIKYENNVKLNYTYNIIFSLYVTFISVLYRVTKFFKNNLEIKIFFNCYEVYNKQLKQKIINKLDFKRNYSFQMSVQQRKKLIPLLISSKSRIRKRFVCLHIRTSNYHNEKFNNIRNSTINNYIEMIKYLVKKGFYVIRLGDSIEIPMQLSCIDGFWDYPSSDSKNEIFDLWLIKNCEFYIGTMSGIIDTAYLFNKKIISVNNIYADFRYSGASFYCMIKNIYNKSTGVLLSEKEYLSRIKDIMEKNDLFQFEENSSQQLLQLIENIFAINNNLIKVNSTHHQIIINYYKNTSFYGTVFYENIKQSKLNVFWTDNK
jgi:putative glycosyltransferase (TIGR04372 family)